MVNISGEFNKFSGEYYEELAVIIDQYESVYANALLLTNV